MNDSNKSSNGLLVLKLQDQVSRETLEALTEQISPLADKLGVEPVVLPPGLDVELKMGSEALLLRVCEALEKIAAQGEAPEVNVAENATQALNARPSSLNSRDPKIYPANNGGKPEAPPAGEPLCEAVVAPPVPQDWGLNSRGEPLAYDGHD